MKRTVLSELLIHRRRFHQGLLSGVLSLSYGCGQSSQVSQTHRGDGPIDVVCTTALAADLIRNLAGPDRAKVHSIMGEGVDPHLYKGSPRDVRDLAEADLIFANGLHLEGKLATVLHHLAHQKLVCLLGDELTLAAEKSQKNDPWIRDSGVPDPHCWFDVRIWAEMATLAAQFLSSYDHPNQAYYEENLRLYLQELQKLDQEMKSTIATIPEVRRTLVTSHDAFRYFGRAYGVQVEGIQGLSTESEAGIRRTNELVDLVVSKRLPAIFVESSVSDDNVRSLVEGARARGHDLRIGGSLFSDAPGAFGTPEGTYIGMMQHNLRTFATAMILETNTISQ